MLKAIFFDLDDTLLWDERSVKEAFLATCQEAEKKYGVNPVELEEAVRSAARELYSSYETYPFTTMIGVNPFEALWANFNDAEHHEQFGKLKEIAPAYRKAAWTNGLKALGVDDPEYGQQLADIFHAERRKRPIVYDETFEILDALKGKYKLLLLTNGSPDLQEKLAGVPELAPYFDHIVISGAFGKGKPDVTIFDHALQLLALKNDEAIMVGDKLTTDILGSSRAKIKNVWINHHKLPLSGEVVPNYEIGKLQELLTIIEGL